MINWLASYPKSGNTWARLLWTAYRTNGLVDINGELTLGDLNATAYQSACVLPLDRYSPASLGLVRYAAMLNLMAMHADQKPLVVKTHYANAERDGVRFIPPRLSGRSVYIVRDPRDVAPSLARHLGKTLDEAVEFMRRPSAFITTDDGRGHILSTWSNHVRSWGAGEPEVTLIRYEDMKRDPHDALSRMLLTFNVDPCPDRVAMAVEACALEKLKAQEKEQGFTEASDKAGSFFGATTEKLNESQRREIENDHGEMMEALGY